MKDWGECEHTDLATIVDYGSGPTCSQCGIPGEVVPYQPVRVGGKLSYSRYEFRPELTAERNKYGW